MIAVEILSPGTRTEDTVRKSHEYAEAGVAHYWIVDRDNATFTALVNTGDGWDVSVELDTDRPADEIDVDGHGTVCIDLEALFAP